MAYVLMLIRKSQLALKAEGRPVQPSRPSNLEPDHGPRVIRHPLTGIVLQRLDKMSSTRGRNAQD